MNGYLICRSPSGQRNHTPTLTRALGGRLGRDSGHGDPVEVLLQRLLLGQDEAPVGIEVRLSEQGIDVVAHSPCPCPELDPAAQEVP